MEDIEVFPTVTWSAGPGCHGNCAQKLYVKDGKVVRIRPLVVDEKGFALD